MSTANGHADLNLAHRTRLAIFWNTGIVTLISIGQFGLMLVMVRLLSPEVYGQYGMLMAIVGFLYVFSAQSFADYTLQVRLERDVCYQDIFTTSVGVSFVLFVATNIIALGVRVLPDYANIQVPLHWLSIGFLLQPGRAVRIAMLKRALDWKRIRMLHGIGAVLSACICIPLAYGGAGIYALLVPTFVVPLPFLYDIFFRCDWRPTWAWDFQRLKPALKFGVNRQLSGAIVAGRRLLESSMVVQVLGFASFGVYGRAIGLAELICNRILGHAIEALYPSLTKIDVGTARFRRISALVLRTSAWLSVPIAALMAQLAAVIVKLIYGDKWLEVIPLVGWSMALATTGAVYFTLYKLLLAHEQQRQCLWTDVLLVAGTVVSLYFLLPSGLVVYMQGLLVTQIALITIAAFLLHSGHGIEAGAVVQAFAAPIVGTACASAVFLDDVAHTFGGLAETVTIGVQVVLYVIIYAIVVRILFPGPLRELVSYMPKQELLHRMLLLDRAQTA
jgi:O-antigen/teichoic acid export membrane protein